MSLSNPYYITIEREHNSSVGDSITFLIMLNGRPKPVADGGSVSFKVDDERFEIPVFIGKNSRKNIEGVIMGVADGNDIDIVWSIDPASKTFGAIKSTTNNTVSFVERPGATR